MRRSESETVKAIVRQSYFQQKSPLRAGQEALKNARTLTQNDNRASRLTAEKRMKVKMMSMTVIQLTVGEKMTQVMSFLHSSVHMRKMPILDQTPNAQGELYLGDQKFTSLSFDLCFLVTALCSKGAVNIVFIVSTIT